MVLSVVAVGGDVRFVMMMMPVTNVSVLISIRVTLTKIIPTSLEEVPVTLFFLNWTSPIIKATDPSYANRLITIIEDYDLYKYDRKGVYSERKLKKNPWLMSPHQVYIANDIAYVVARNGDTFKDLGKEFDISWRKLVKYNDLQRDYTLMEGDIIYLKSKKKKASKPYTVYVVKDGDSMHGISQKYGIRLKNLYKMNRKDGEYVPEIGDRLRLR